MAHPWMSTRTHSWSSVGAHHCAAFGHPWMSVTGWTFIIFGHLWSSSITLAPFSLDTHPWAPSHPTVGLRYDRAEDAEQQQVPARGPSVQWEGNAATACTGPSHAAGGGEAPPPPPQPPAPVWGGRASPGTSMLGIPSHPQPSAVEEEAARRVDDLLESYMGIRDCELGGCCSVPPQPYTHLPPPLTPLLLQLRPWWRWRSAAPRPPRSPALSTQCWESSPSPRSSWLRCGRPSVAPGVGRSSRGAARSPPPLHVTPLGVAVLLEVPTCPPSHTQTGGVGPLWVPMAPPHPVGHTVLHKLCFIGGSQSRIGGGGEHLHARPVGYPILSHCAQLLQLQGE